MKFIPIFKFVETLDISTQAFMGPMLRDSLFRRMVQNDFLHHFVVMENNLGKGLL